MFFSWYSKNKHFKKNSNLRGQIAPFVIVILAILLIAAISTINIGRIALDKTASANSADSGALAAASTYAGAFNALAQMNNEYLWVNYMSNRVVMNSLQGKGKMRIDDAVMYTATAIALASGAYYSILPSPSCPVLPNPGHYGAAALFTSAAAAATLAAAEVNKFITVASYMRSIVDSHYASQKAYYEYMCESMRAAKINSNDLGYNYAFQNSGISNKLANDQQDAFSNWLGSKANIGNYTWQDKLGQQHSVIMNVKVPEISYYNLQKTTKDYIELGSMIDAMSKDEKIIIIALNVQAGILDTAAGSTIVVCGFEYSSVIYFWLYMVCVAGCSIASGTCVAGCIPLMISSNRLCDWARVLWGEIVRIGSGVVLALSSVGAIGGGGMLALLRDSLENAYYGFMRDGNYASSSCGDIGNNLLVKISSVVLPTWNIEVCAKQIHPGVSQGIVATQYPEVNSCAKASFDGGDVGTFKSTYDTRLTSVD